MIGFRPEQIRRLPVTAALRFDLAALSAPPLLRTAAPGRVPWLVVGNGGRPPIPGTVDPLAELAEVCEREPGCGCTSMPLTAGPRC